MLCLNFFRKPYRCAVTHVHLLLCCRMLTLILTTRRVTTTPCPSARWVHLSWFPLGAPAAVVKPSGYLKAGIRVWRASYWRGSDLSRPLGLIYGVWVAELISAMIYLLFENTYAYSCSGIIAGMKVKHNVAHFSNHESSWERINTPSNPRHVPGVI